MTNEEIAGFFNNARPHIQDNPNLRDTQVIGWFRKRSPHPQAITPEKLAALGAALRLESGARVLDLGSGSGEMLCFGRGIRALRRLHA
jgi:hypothetical protein